MRATPSDYHLKQATTLEEALVLLSDKTKGYLPFAGGTDLMVQFEMGKLQNKNWVSIWGLKELKGIEEQKDFIRLGALTTYTEIKNHSLIKTHFPNLIASATETGARAIQNRGTIGGNIANASPAADTPPSLLSYDAEIEMISKGGVRRIPFSDFYLDYKKTELKTDELITAVYLPKLKYPLQHFFHKVGTRRAQSISKVVMAATIHKNEDVVQQVRIAVGSMGPTPLRCLKTEKFLTGKKLNSQTVDQAKSEIQQDIAPKNDIRSTEHYRRVVAANLLEEFLLIK